MVFTWQWLWQIVHLIAFFKKINPLISISNVHSIYIPLQLNLAHRKLTYKCVCRRITSLITTQRSIKKAIFITALGFSDKLPCNKLTLYLIKLLVFFTLLWYIDVLFVSRTHLYPTPVPVQWFLELTSRASEHFWLSLLQTPKTVRNMWKP